MIKQTERDLYRGRSPREIPAYSPFEASHYLRVPENTIRNWASGYSSGTRAGKAGHTNPTILMPHGILEWDLDQLQHAMHLNVDDVRAYFTDGHRVSFMLERRLMREVLVEQSLRNIERALPDAAKRQQRLRTAGQPA